MQTNFDTIATIKLIICLRKIRPASILMQCTCYYVNASLSVLRHASQLGYNMTHYEDCYNEILDIRMAKIIIMISY